MPGAAGKAAVTTAAVTHANASNFATDASLAVAGAGVAVVVQVSQQQL